MGTCVEKLPHKTDKCNSGDGLQVFEDEGKFTGYCFACDTYVPDPYGEGNVRPPTKIKKKTKEEIANELEEIEQCDTEDVPQRKLRKEALEYFGVKVGKSRVDGKTPSILFYPRYKDGVLVDYKANLLSPKKMWIVAGAKDCDLFGWEQAIRTGAKRLIITEGEKDAVALKRIVDMYTKEAFQEHKPAIVSIPNGAASAAKDIGRLASKIRPLFKEVVLCFDQDAAGKAAVDDVLKIYPEAFSATLPCKDVLDCVEKGMAKAAFAAITFNYAKPKNTRLVLGSSLTEAARTAPEWGFSYPWKGLTDLTRGIRLGETIYVGAGVKMGKSEIVNSLSAHCITEHGWKVFLAKPEESNRKTYQLLVGKLAGKIFHDPKIPFDFAAYDKYEPKLRDGVVMVNLYQHLGWDTLKLDIQEAANMGCKAIFIDPITNLTNHMSAGEANEKLIAIAAELASMAMDLNVVIFIFCHLKAPVGGAPHEAGGEIFSSQFAGSRAMMRSCHYMFGLWGNKSLRVEEKVGKELVERETTAEERNRRSLILLEDREFGEVGEVGLYWDQKTGLFNEIPRFR